MTHPTYTQQALCRYNLPRLKRIAAELGVTPTGDKRAAQTWVNAIITHQSTQLQKVDEQATAQAELDHFIADQAQAVAPEPFRIVEISFEHHEYYAGDELVASISHDDNHLTQRWVAKPIRNYQFAIRSYFLVGARLPTNLQLSNWNLARKLRIAN